MNNALVNRHFINRTFPQTFELEMETNRKNFYQPIKKTLSCQCVKCPNQKGGRVILRRYCLWHDIFQQIIPDI